MATDLIIMGSSADRSAADVNIPINSGETMVTPTGNFWIPLSDSSVIKGGFVNSETAAMVETWFKPRKAQDRMKLWTTHLQTDPVRTQVLNLCNYPISTNDTIEAAGENAGAVLDILGLYVSKTGGEEIPTPFPTKPIPANAQLVEATGATTLTADVLSAPGDLTFVDYVLDNNKSYKIIGMGMHGATAHAARLRFTTGPNVGDCPGVIAADTSTSLEYMMWYGDFGTFEGRNPPRFQAVGSAGDTAQVFRFLMVPG